MKKRAKWKTFESELTHYLNHNYKNSELDFVNKGGSNAFSNDILVYKNRSYYFSIEAKYLPSQCGQITLKEKNNGFVFSKQSRQKFMPQTQIIIDMINAHELLEQNDPRIFAWVQAYYFQKNATWFGLSQSYKDLNSQNVYLCQTKDLSAYVNVDAILRKKKSGSSRLPYRLIEKALRLVENKLPDALCHSKGILHKKLFVKCENPPADSYLSEELYLSFKGDKLYEVRKLSKTRTWTLTFSMELKEKAKKSSSLL